MKKAVKGIVIAASCIILILVVLFALYEAYLARYVGDKEPYDASTKPIADEITVMSFNVRYRAFEDLFKKSWPLSPSSSRWAMPCRCRSASRLTTEARWRPRTR